MSDVVRHVGISLGRIKHFDEGLGEFAYQLCGRIAQNAEALWEQDRVRLHFYLRKPLRGAFGEKVRYHTHSRLYRWWHPSLTTYSLWHRLTQLDTSRPAGKPRQAITTIHDLNFLYDPSCTDRAQRFRKLSRQLADSTAVACISDYVRQDVGTHLQWSGPSHTIYNGVSDLTTVALAQPEFPNLNQPFLLHLSRMAPNKNVESILGMAEAWPSMLFVLAGGGDIAHTAVLKQHAQQKKLSNVLFVGHVSVEEKAWLYAHCEALLFPSLAEGFGLPVIEAMYFGKPVFLSRKTVLPEIGGEAAYYWDDFSSQSMVALTQSVLSHPHLQADRLRIQQHARQFSWDHCADQYLALYRHMLSRSRN